MTGRMRVPTLLLAGALLSSCSALLPRQQANLELFETWWQALDDGYPFFAEKQVDWHALGAQYRSAVVYADSQVDLYHLLAGMLCELRDPHVRLEVPDAAFDDPEVVSLFDLVGFEWAVVEGRLYAAAWPAGQAPVPPSHLDGAAARWPEIVQLEGYPLSLALMGVLAKGRSGSAAELRLRWRDGTISRHVLRRPAHASGHGIRIAAAGGFTPRLLGMPRRLEDVASVDWRGRLAILRLETLDPEELGVDRERLVAHLDRLLDEVAVADGIAIDLRHNGGGLAAVAALIVGRFLRVPHRTVLASERESYLGGLLSVLRYGKMDWAPRPPRIDRPLCVLTSWRTGSAAEHMARILQLDCAAIVVGERTAGAEAFLERVPGPDGSTLVYGRGRAMESSGRGLQDDGVVPDVVVGLSLADIMRCGSWAAARAEWDQRVLAAAEQLLRAPR